MHTVVDNYLKRNKVSLNKLLNNLFNKKVKNITYLGNCKLRKMPEYKFNLLKYNIVLEDYSNHCIFIRLINDEKIEENLFCYWFFCEEYFGLSKKYYAPKANIVNVQKKNYEIKYNMQILNKQNKLWKSSYVDIINLKKYCEQKMPNTELINKSIFIAVI